MKRKSKRATSHKRGGASRYGGNRPHRGESQKYGGQIRVGGMRANRGQTYGKR